MWRTATTTGGVIKTQLEDEAVFCNTTQSRRFKEVRYKSSCGVRRTTEGTEIRTPQTFTSKGIRIKRAASQVKRREV